MADEEVIRLSKRMSELGLCSRREADQLIEAGKVLVDGSVVSKLGSRVHRGQEITLTKSGQADLDGKKTILINKPVGYVSAQAEPGYTPAIRLITAANQSPSDQPKEIPQNLKSFAPAGRLDIDSKGLLILTQDGLFAAEVIKPDSDIEKEYHVRTDRPLTDKELERLHQPIQMDDRTLKPVKVLRRGEAAFTFLLKEGRKRQIRRMIEIVGAEVVFLKRVRIGKIKLAGLREGHWRYLKPGESLN